MDKISLYINCYNALAFRQRVMLLLAFLSTVYLFASVFFLQPLSDKSKNLVMENAYLGSLSEEAEMLDEKSGAGGRALDIVDLNKKLSQLKGEVEILNLELKEYFSIASSADDLMSIVKDLVNTTEGLTLERIEMLPAEKITIALGEMAGAQIETDIHNNSDALVHTKDVVVFKHKMSLDVVGDYTSLTRYLQKIESLEWGLFIQDIVYRVELYPDSSASIILYSLSISGDGYEV